jgi:hypothetical protein
MPKPKKPDPEIELISDNSGLLLAMQLQTLEMVKLNKALNIPIRKKPATCQVLDSSPVRKPRETVETRSGKRGPEERVSSLEHKVSSAKHTRSRGSDSKEA